MIALFDFLLILSVLFLFTQLFLPYILPNYFEYFWLFKKKPKNVIKELGELDSEVELAIQQQEEATKQYEKTIEKIEKTEKVINKQKNNLKNKKN